MDPVTHVLTGAVLARTGLNRRAAYTTIAMAIAAEFPDTDVFWSLAGPVQGLKHHRGITHTFLGIPFEAAVIVGAIWLFHRWYRSKAKTEAAGKSPESRLPAAPVRWTSLYGFVLLALLSHILLDWTNNYGVRPLFPFDPHWYAGSFLFIFDPVFFLILMAALVLPSLFRLIGSEIGAASKSFAPPGWAVGAVLLSFVWLGFRAVEHAKAVTLSLAQSVDSGDSGAAVTSQVLTPRRAEVSPDPFSPFRWHAAVDFGSFIQLEEVHSRIGLVVPEDGRVNKPVSTPALQSALDSPLGRVYLDWSPMPVISVSEGEAGQSATGGAATTVVFFRDPRFMGDVPILDRSGPPPLSGTVELDQQNQIVGQTMDGREQNP